jgi:hypothetical protein
MKEQISVFVSKSTRLKNNEICILWICIHNIFNFYQKLYLVLQYV